MPTNPWVIAFLRENQRRNLSPHTIYDRRRFLHRYIEGIRPEDPLTVDQESIESWLDTLNIGPRSRATYLVTLSAFHSWLEDAGHRDDDPPLPSVVARAWHEAIAI